MRCACTSTGPWSGSRTDTTALEPYLGYWRVGGDVLSGWPNTPTTRNFAGGVDEVAIYPTALSQATIQAQYALRNGGGGGNQPPSASFTWGATGLTASFNGSGSSDPDGSVTGYAWNFGDGSTGSGVTPSHTYAAAGTYTAQLTVTDNQGATGTPRDRSASPSPVPGAIATDALQPHRRRRLGPGRHRWRVGADDRRVSNFSVAGGLRARCRGRGARPVRRRTSPPPRRSTSTCGPPSRLRQAGRPAAGSTPPLVVPSGGHVRLPGQGAGHRDRHHGIPRRTVGGVERS